MMEPPPTLHTILAARQVAKSSLDLKCAEKHLIAITQSITSWKQLSPFLGLSRQDEEDIEADNSKNAERKVAMMRRWSEKFGEEATYLKMAEAFETLQWRNCICDLLDLLQDSLRTAGAEATGPPRGEALQRNPTSPLDSTPQSHQLLRLVGRNGEEIKIRDRLSPNWEDLFLCLGFEPAEENHSMITAIRRNNVGKVEDACRDVLLKWLAGNGRKPVTWATFIDALIDMGESTLADKIRELLTDKGTS